MPDSFHDRLDQFGRKHPRLMLWSTIVVAVVTTLIMIYNTTDTAIVYKAF
jgi:hypothetical protein